MPLGSMIASTLRLASVFHKTGRAGQEGGMRRDRRVLDFRQICLAVATGVLISGCASGAAKFSGNDRGQTVMPGERNPQSASLTPMSDDDLRTTFRDVLLSDLGEYPTGPELFTADGKVTKFSRVRVEGRFWIADGELCVVSNGHPPPMCRRFARDAGGQVYLTSLRDENGENRLGGAIPMSVTRPQRGEGIAAVPIGGEARLQGPQPSGFVPMGEEDLRATFQNVTISLMGDVHSYPEQFRSDGQYVLHARGQPEGRFWIEGDELCVATVQSGAETCRRFARDGEGAIFLTAYRDDRGSRIIGEPAPVSVEPIKQ